jgi:hypothetical protein
MHCTEIYNASLAFDSVNAELPMIGYHLRAQKVHEGTNQSFAAAEHCAGTFFPKISL